MSQQRVKVRRARVELQGTLQMACGCVVDFGALARSHPTFWQRVRERLGFAQPVYLKRCQNDPRHRSIEDVMSPGGVKNG
jgi:hypothetical protein